jgi:hypothetical protein
MRVLMLLVAFLAWFSAPASAGEEVAAAQAVIRSQIEAISHDDAVAAYSFAAPAIQSMIADAGTFMAIVREHYVPIYRHKAFQFGETSVSDGKIAQEVHIIDADGLPWEGLYMLDRQPDGSMKISGCVLTKAPSQPI